MPKPNIEAEARLINLALKADCHRVAIQVRGKMLSLVATLPPRPGSRRTTPHQQRIPLKIGATAKGLSRARKKAVLLSAQMDEGKFTWEEWIEIALVEVDEETCGYWLEKFKAHVLPRLGGDKEYRWKKQFLYFGFNRLPIDKPLTPSVIIQAVLTKDKPAARDRTVSTFQRFAKFAGVDVDLTPFKVGHSPKERTIPDDDVVQRTIDGISDPQWRQVFALMAIYGLRNHEAFLAQLEQRQTAKGSLTVAVVPDEAKTGHHVAFPHKDEWVERWAVASGVVPDLTVMDNQIYGTKSSEWWRDNVTREFTAYALRHAYAIRCHLAGIGVAIAAKCMGHSPEMHLKTYQRWLGETAQLKAWESLQTVTTAR